ncbi:MAG: AAA family ATPase [Parvularculaceae bacterium]|nr:AAA family ATPase [Parvularculaceae bacterium]
MYEEFYGLTEKPFSIQPDPSFLYWGRGHRLAYAMLEYGVVNHAGISVVTGEVGCGKTTLIHRLLDQLSDTHTIALLSNIQPGRGDLLSWVLMGFGEPYAGKTHVEMFSQLQSFFIREYSRNKRVILIIDEAQNLSVDMLEEIRMLSNINAGKDQLLQLILVGQPQLKDLLSRPDMLQLAQRIGSDFHLTPLTREEVHAYLETRLSIAGARRNIFSEGAMDLVAEQSRGVPRVINIIADTALVYGFSAQEEIVDEEIIRSVIRDKHDYGVFGVPSSPDLKLAEQDERRLQRGGFANDETEETEPRIRTKARNRGEKRRRAVNEKPRLVSNLDVRFVSEPADFDISARGAADDPEADEAPFSKTDAPRREAKRFQAIGAKSVPASEAAPPVESRPQQKLGANAEIGVIVVCGDDDAPETFQSIAGARAVVAVAPADTAKALREAGVESVDLDSMGGGRARNAGYRRLKKIAPQIQFVQFVQAGQRLKPGWFADASSLMMRRPEVAALEGRVDLLPDSSRTIFNHALEKRAASDGEIQATGPTAIFRTDAFEAAGGFRGDIVADETADLCIRLRRRGAHVWRSESAMASCEERRVSFADWRARARARGYEFAAGAALHGGSPERYCASDQSRAVMWGAVFPAIVAIAAIIGGSAVALLSISVNPVVTALSIIGAGALIYALKIAASAATIGLFRPRSWLISFVRSFGHFYECAGVARYWFGSGKSAPSRKPGA